MSNHGKRFSKVCLIFQNVKKVRQYEEEVNIHKKTGIIFKILHIIDYRLSLATRQNCVRFKLYEHLNFI